MATKIVLNLAVLLLVFSQVFLAFSQVFLAISEVVHTAGPRELPPPAKPMTASSLLDTSISGDSPSSGFEVTHGGGASEEKALLDAPENVWCPPSPHLQADQVAKGITEEKALLDAPKNWCLPPPAMEGRKIMLVSREA